MSDPLNQEMRKAIARYRQSIGPSELERARLLRSLKKEFDSAELTVRELAETFNQGVAAMEETTPPEQEAPTTPLSQEKVSTEVDEETTERPRRRRRGIGSELTLDD